MRSFETRAANRVLTVLIQGRGRVSLLFICVRVCVGETFFFFREKPLSKTSKSNFIQELKDAPKMQS